MVKLHCKTQQNQMTRCTFKDEPKTKREREKGCIYTTPCGSLYHATRSCGKLKAARRIIIQGAFCPRATAYVRVSVRACAEGGLRSLDEILQ